MQYIPVEIFLELSAIFAGVIFAVIALIGVYYYSTDIQYRRWAFSHLAFWIAFLPSNILADAPYIGNFIGTVLRVLGSLILLRAFNYPRFSHVPNKILHPLGLIAITIFWTPIVLLSLPANSGALLCSLFMAFAFGFASKEILTNTRDRSKIWLLAGFSYLLWTISTIPMTLLPFIPEVVLFGYIQFIAQSLVMITVFLSFIGNITETARESMKLAETTSNIITHDLRNYLNVASSSLDLVEGADDESSKMIEAARSALQDASIFMHRTRSMLIDISSFTPSSVDLDLTILVEEAVMQAKKEHLLTDSQIVTNMKGYYYASTSPLMKQVVWNIIDNSIMHSKSAPILYVDLLRDNDIILSISDRSGGIDDIVKAHIKNARNDTNCLGLGLMLVREISNMCGVSLCIEDVVEDGVVVGTTFQLTFPIAGGIPS